MRLVIKLGGSLLTEISRRRPLLEQLMRVHNQGHRCLLVHGGGKLLTSYLEKAGISSQFIHGLRVTDAPTRDAALMVMGGLLNKQLVVEIQNLGGRALGVCGDAGLITARKAESEAYGGADLGYVGEVEHVDGRLLAQLHALGLIVVMASLAPDARGEFYNINADLLAASCAAALQADRLIFLTDVDGVLDAGGNRLNNLSRDQVDSLVAQGAVGGGMLPKLKSCLMALEKGVQCVRIVPGYGEGSLLRALEPKLDSRGTEIR
ncbi:MAG TPA: acetylglutamate kinase [Acidobacteriota bacterium]